MARRTVVGEGSLRFTLEWGEAEPRGTAAEATRGRLLAAIQNTVVWGEGEGGFQPDIPNWWFKLEGEIVKNPVRPLIRQLGDLPMPDRELIYNKHAPTRNSPIKHFMAGRGCPYHCTYCFNHA